MVNSSLIHQLIKELETERGCPVQLQVDTPKSYGEPFGMRGEIGRQVFGEFSERKTIVRRVEGVDKTYFSDLRLIEGSYESLGEVASRIEELNALYDAPDPGNLAHKAYALVRKLGINSDRGLVGNGLSWNFKEMFVSGPASKGGLTAKIAYKILDRAGMKYLRHNLFVVSDGVYDRGQGSGGTVVLSDKRKIAEITLAPFE